MIQASATERTQELEGPEPDPDDARVSSARRIDIANPNRYPEAGVRAVRPWLEAVTSSLVADATATLSVRFVSDRAMRELNRRFRDKNLPTDVLSFPGSETPEGVHLGDIAVSIPTARRQALARGHSVRREIRVLLLHGLLHCMGHDHETDDGEMARLERRLRRRWIDRDD